MRADGLWHPRLLQILTGLGHTDMIVVADAGLPVPPGVEPIDLLWRRGEPGFLPIVRMLLAEAVFESATRAVELTDRPTLDGLSSALADIPVATMPHAELKRCGAGARAIVRTGEATPYANLILHAGVPF